MTKYIFIPATIFLIILYSCGDSNKKILTKYKDSFYKTDITDTIMNYFTGNKKNILFRYYACSANHRLIYMNSIQKYYPKVIVCNEIHDEQINESGSIENLSIIFDSSSKLTVDNEQFTNIVNGENILIKMRNLSVASNKPYDVLKENNISIDTTKYKSKLLIRGKEIAFYNEEYSADTTRIDCITKINNLYEFLNSFKSFLDDNYTENEFIKKLPDNSYTLANSNEEKRDNIKLTFNSNHLYVEGYLNMLEKGFIFVKVLNKDKFFNEDLVTDSYQTREYIGWSNDADYLFYFNLGRIHLSGEKNIDINAEIQLWFHSQTKNENQLVLTEDMIIKLKDYNNW